MSRVYSGVQLLHTSFHNRREVLLELLEPATRIDPAWKVPRLAVYCIQEGPTFRTNAENRNRHSLSRALA
jgi:purine nucleoside phosphorylase